MEVHYKRRADQQSVNRPELHYDDRKMAEQAPRKSQLYDERTSESARPHKKIMIGIQARSSSERLPRKVWMEIGTKMMIDKVIDACKSAQQIVTNNQFRDAKVYVALLVPTGDPLYNHYKQDAHIVENFHVLEGPLDDVLTRYVMAADQLRADYICRVTGDCPMIPPPVITKHIVTAFKGGLDYTSNVFPGIRTEPDGFDCEVLSAKLLDYLHKNAKSQQEREHVTFYLRDFMPHWAKKAQFIGYVNREEHKYSVDTIDDFAAVKRNIEMQNDKINLARASGFKVYRF